MLSVLLMDERWTCIDDMSSSNQMDSDQMDSDGKFGRGPRVLSGAVDLISRYKLLNHHSFFCKKPLPPAISDTHYLNNVVGDTEIRKGDGMELDQLFQNSYQSEETAHIQPFDMETLGHAFQLRETAPVELPSAEKGTPTTSGKSKIKSKDRVKKHKKHIEKDKDKGKEKEQRKYKHRHKDRSKDKDKDKEEEARRNRKFGKCPKPQENTKAQNSVKGLC